MATVGSTLAGGGDVDRFRLFYHVICGAGSLSCGLEVVAHLGGGESLVVGLLVG